MNSKQLTLTCLLITWTFGVLVVLVVSEGGAPNFSIHDHKHTHTHIHAHTEQLKQSTWAGKELVSSTLATPGLVILCLCEVH